MAYTPPTPPVAETAASRFNRDIQQIPVAVAAGDPALGTWNGLNNDNRKARTWDLKDEERKEREYAGAGSLVATVAPAVTGTAQVGQTLTTTNGTWTNTPTTLARKWYADGVEISGATGTTYVVQAGDEGKKITSRVTASKTGYTDNVATSNETAAVIAA